MADDRIADFPRGGDDELNRPRVTPDPAPPDDQLIRMAAVSTVAGLVAVLLAFRWIRRNIVITRRRT